MTRQFWVAVILITSVCVAGLLAWIIYVVRRKEKYTRDRFAFISLATLTTAAATILSELAGKVTPWQVIANFVGRLRGLPPPPPDPPHFADHILMVILWACLAAFAYRIYMGWNGAISERQFDSQRLHIQPSLVADGLREGKRLILREPPLAVHQPGDQRSIDAKLLGNREVLAWHLQARDLLALRNVHYELEPTNWHPKARCWIGWDRQSGRAIAAYCDLKTATYQQLNEFVTYASRIIKRERGHSSETEFLVLIKEIPPDQPPVLRRIGASPIQTFTEDQLLENLVDFSDYYLDIRTRAAKRTLPDSSVTLLETYAPTCFSNQDKTISGDTEKYLLEWVQESGQRQLALLGEYGQGKSSTALIFTYNIISEPTRMTRIPILLELRGKSPKNMTPEDLLAGWAYAYRIDPKAVMKLHEKGKLILILEGFDEIAQVGDIESRLAHFRTLWSFTGMDTKVLITGRPNFFLDDAEMKAALGISQPTGTGPYCEAIHLLPLDMDQIKEALRCCKQEVRDGILKLADKDPKFREVISRGSLLYVVSQLWERKALWKYEGPLNSAKILELFLDSSYRRQSQKSRGGTPFMLLNDAERRYFTLGVAAFMGAENLPNQIDRADFTRAVSALYNVVPSGLASDVDGFSSGGSGRPLKQRLEGEDDPVECVENDVRSSGILVVDQTKPGALRFAHKSFMEFLVAKAYANNLGESGNEAAAAIVAATNLKARTIIRSKEICSFFVEILLEGGSGDPKRIGRELYLAIVTKPAERSRVPRVVRDWVILLLLLAKIVGNPLPTSKEPSLKQLTRLSAILVLLVSVLTVLIIRIGTDVHHLSPKDTHAQTSFAMIGLILVAGAIQSFALSYFGASEILTNLTLWLASCELLGLTSAEIGDGYAGSIVLKALIYQDQAKSRG